MLTPAIKRGSAEFLVLSLLAHQPRHGYDLCKLIASRSRGVLTFHVASLYPLLYRLEARGWIAGRWVERPGERRRRYYRLSAAGRRALGTQRERWDAFVAAVARIADPHRA